MKVRIRNFQSIQDLELEINGFTVLVGKNNIGKSAIRRAINGALTNATGTSFVREGTKSTHVEIETDKLTLVWEKGSGSNSYIVNGQDYERVGRGAPEEIAKLGFRQIVLSNKEKINPQFADTHSPIFLLDKPGPAVAELISSVSRLSVINHANRLCDKDGREIRSKLKIRDADIQLVEQRLERFADFSNLQESNDLLQRTWEEILLNGREVSLISEYETQLVSHNESINQLSGAVEIQVPEDIVSADLLDLQKLEEQTVKFDQLEASIDRLLEASDLEIPQPEFEESSEIVQLDKWLSSIESLGTQIKRTSYANDLKIPTVQDMILEELQTITQLVTLHETLGDEIAKLEASEVSRFEELDNLEKELHEELGDLETCPICDKLVH